MNEKELYKKAIEKWGRVLQHIMLFEEMAELQKCITKLMRAKDPLVMMSLTNDTIEEIVDVEIMLEQTKELLAIDEERYNEVRLYKLDRLRDMLN